MTQTIVIDAKGHLAGRLASCVASELLLGKKVVLLRCEDILISGSLRRHTSRYAGFLNKRCNVNPSKGPFHLRAPSMQMYLKIRGMMPYKTRKGGDAMRRLVVLEGVPAPFDKMKRVVCPNALKHLRLDPNDKVCRLGALATKVGWKYEGIVAEFEEKRKAKSSEYYEQKKKSTQLRNEILGNNEEIQKINASLAEFGF